MSPETILSLTTEFCISAGDYSVTEADVRDPKRSHRSIVSIRRQVAHIAFGRGVSAKAMAAWFGRDRSTVEGWVKRMSTAPEEHPEPDDFVKKALQHASRLTGHPVEEIASNGSGKAFSRAEGVLFPRTIIKLLCSEMGYGYKAVCQLLQCKPRPEIFHKARASHDQFMHPTFGVESYRKLYDAMRKALVPAPKIEQLRSSKTIPVAVYLGLAPSHYLQLCVADVEVVNGKEILPKEYDLLPQFRRAARLARRTSFPTQDLP